MWGISWLVETLPASKEGICSTELVIIKKKKLSLVTVHSSYYLLLQDGTQRTLMNKMCRNIRNWTCSTLKVNYVFKMNKGNFFNNYVSTLYL